MRRNSERRVCFNVSASNIFVSLDFTFVALVQCWLAFGGTFVFVWCWIAFGYTSVFLCVAEKDGILVLSQLGMAS